MSLKNDHVHGDYPLASTVNSISDTLDTAHDALGDVAMNFPTLADVSSGQFIFPHVKRYLWFQSTGTIEDISGGGGETVSISEENNKPTKYDLDSVSWLYYGLIYRVSGVSWCMESET